MKELLIEVGTGIGLALLAYISFYVKQYVDQKKEQIYDQNRNTKLDEIKKFISQRMIEAVEARTKEEDFDDYEEMLRSVEYAVEDVIIALPKDTIAYLTKHLLRDEQQLRKWLQQIGLGEAKRKRVS